jgi:hypothetical protein
LTAVSITAFLQPAPPAYPELGSWDNQAKQKRPFPPQSKASGISFLDLGFQPFALEVEAGENHSLGHEVEAEHDPDTGQRNPFGA